jgi:hypothetical protein
MKNKTLVLSFAFFVVVLAGVGIFAADKERYGFFVPSQNEEMYGTWVNAKYDGMAHVQKFVYYYWGYGEEFRKVADKDPSAKWTFTIVDKWSDSDGSIWYKSYVITNNDFSVWFILSKISNHGTVFELVENVGDFPTAADLNPNNSNYYIDYRQ